MASLAPTSRAREVIPGNEEAGSELKLGEFEGIHALSHSEAALIINAVEARRKQDGKNINETENLIKTQDYLVRFARFKIKESVEAVERLLSARTELASFEKAQLGSLCCDTAEEAKTLIPSLVDKISDEELQELLDEITKLMGYGVN